MTDIASLGIKLDTTQVRQGVVDLESLARSASNVERTVSDAERATQRASNEISGSVGRVSAALNAARTAISSFSSNITSAMSSAMASINSLMQSIGSTITGSFSSAFASVRSFFSTAFSGLSSVFSGLSTTIASGLSSAFSGISSLLSPLITSIQSSLSSAFSGLGSVFSSILPGVSAVFSSISASVSSFASSIASGLSRAFSGALSSISGFASSLYSGVSGALSRAITAVGSFASSLSAGLSRVWSSAVSGVSGFASSLWSGLSSAFSGIVSRVSGLAGSLISGFSSAWSGILSGMGGFLSSLSSRFSAAFSSISAYLGSFASSMSGMFSSLFGSMSGFVRSLGSLPGMIAGLGIAVLGGEIFQVNKEMQSLRTSLETVTGSAAGAEAAFKKIQEFAAVTPYSVKEITEAFIKLNNYGLTAGEAALTSYGNTASAMGKTLNQMIEAVADASSGEFERLKEFGIKSAKSGDEVAFTFKGVTTTIKNSADEIEQYLQKIGNSDFAGGMERQAAIIDGALSTLGDSWSNLLDSVITPSGEKMIASFISSMSDGINAITNFSGTLITIGDTNASVGDYIEATWLTIKNAVSDSIDGISSKFSFLSDAATVAGSFISEVFATAWRQVKDLAIIAFNGIVGAVNGLGQAIGVAAAGIVQVFAQAFEKVKSMAGGLGLGVEAALSGDFSFKDLNTAFDKKTLSIKEVQLEMGRALKGALNVDYAGDVGTKIGGMATQLHSLRTQIDANNAASVAAHDSTKKLGSAHEEAAGKAKKHADAHKGVSDAAKAAKKDQQELANLIGELATPQEKFNTQMAKATGYYNAGKIDLELYSRALAKYSDELNKSADNGFQAVTAQEKLNESYKKAWELIDGKNGKTVSPEGGAQLLSDAASSYTKEVAPKYTDSSNKALDEYNKLIQEIDKNTGKLGATNSAVFDGALGGISALSGAFGNMTDAINAATVAQEKLNSAKNGALSEIKTSQDDEFGKAVKEKKALYEFDVASKKLTQEKTEAELSGARQIAGAAAKLFQEKSTAAKAFHAIEQTIAIAQMAMQVQSIASNVAATASGVVAGAAKFFAQSGWAAFAGIAAMIGVIGALGGSTSSPSMPSIDTSTQGTVLGDKNASSTTTEDIGKIMEDIHASEYLALLNINDSIKGLNKSILAAVTGVFQRGDMATPNLPNNTTSMFINTNNEVSQNILKGAGNTLGAILDGWVFDLTQFVETKKTTNYLFGHRVKTATSENDVSDQTNRDITDIFKNIGNVLVESGKIFGTDVNDAVKNIQIPDLKIDIKGMTGEEATKYINSYISTTIDNIAEDIFPLLKDYRAIGEGMGTTLVRVAGDVGVVTSVFDNLGVQLPKTAQGLIHVSEALVSAAGGIDKLQTGLDNFYRKFYSEQEQFNTNVKFLTENLARKPYYMQLPEDRTGYKALTESKLSQAGIDAELYATAKKQLDAAFTAAYEPWLKHLDIRKANAEKYGGEDLRLYQEDLKKAEAAANEATKSNSGYVATLKETADKSASAASLLLEQSDNADQYYKFLEEGIAGVRDQALLMATNVKTGTYTVDVASKTFTDTLLRLADAMGSADRAAKALEVSNTLGFSKNEQVVNVQQSAQAAFDNEASKYGLAGLKFDDAVAASKNVNAGIRSGELSSTGTVEYGGKTYSVAGILAFNLDYTQKLFDAMTNTVSTGQGTGNNVYTSPSGEAAKLVDDPTKVLTKGTTTGSSSINQDLSKGIADAAKSLTEFLKPFKDDAATRGMNDYQKELYSLTSTYDDNLAKAKELTKVQEDLDLVTNKYKDDVKELGEKYAQMLSDFMAPFKDSAATQGMSDYQKELYNLNSQYQKNITDAKKLGATDADLLLITNANTAAINDRVTAINKEREALIKTAQTNYSRLNSSSIQTELYSIMDNFIGTMATVIDKGGSFNDLVALYDMAIATGTRATQKAVDEIKQNFATIYDNISTKRNSISDDILKVTDPNGLVETQRQRAIQDLQSTSYDKQIAAIDTLQNLAMDNYQKQIDAATTLKDSIKQIQEYVQNLLVGALSPLSNEAKLNESRAQYQTQLVMAKAGDKDAIANITKYADTYLNQARDYYASSPAYAEIFNNVTGELNNGINAVDTEALKIQYASQTVAYLNDINTSLNNIETQRRAAEAEQIKAANDSAVAIQKTFVDAIAGLNGFAELLKTQPIETQIKVALSGNLSDKQLDMITALYTGNPQEVFNAVIGATYSGELTTAQGITIFDRLFAKDPAGTFSAFLTAGKAGILTNADGVWLFEHMFAANPYSIFSSILSATRAGELSTDMGLATFTRMFELNPNATFSATLTAIRSGVLLTDEGVTLFNRMFTADPRQTVTSTVNALLAGTLTFDEFKYLYNTASGADQSVILTLIGDMVAQGTLSYASIADIYAKASGPDQSSILGITSNFLATGQLSYQQMVDAYIKASNPGKSAIFKITSDLAAAGVLSMADIESVYNKTIQGNKSADYTITVKKGAWDQAAATLSTLPVGGTATVNASAALKLDASLTNSSLTISASNMLGFWVSLLENTARTTQNTSIIAKNIGGSGFNARTNYQAEAFTAIGNLTDMITGAGAAGGGYYGGGIADRVIGAFSGTANIIGSQSAQDVGTTTNYASYDKTFTNMFSPMVEMVSWLSKIAEYTKWTANNVVASAVTITTAILLDTAVDWGNYKRFASGGIANQASIFGEAGPEAAVPLPDGRTIPVTLSGNAGGSNKETVEELKNAVAELRILRRENGQKQDVIAQRLAMLERRLSQIEANGALAGAA